MVNNSVVLWITSTPAHRADGVASPHPRPRRPSRRQPLIRGDAPVTQVIAIANQKGGVGKTTTGSKLAGALEEQGYRVLCIDMDPQANLTAGLGINLNTVERSMADALADGRATPPAALRPPAGAA